MQVATEELGVQILRKRYGEQTDAEIVFELHEKTGELGMRATFVGEGFDPLAEGDALSLRLLESAVCDPTFCQEGHRGVVQARVRTSRVG